MPLPSCAVPTNQDGKFELVVKRELPVPLARVACGSPSAYIPTWLSVSGVLVTSS